MPPTIKNRHRRKTSKKIKKRKAHRRADKITKLRRVFLGGADDARDVIENVNENIERLNGRYLLEYVGDMRAINWAEPSSTSSVDKMGVVSDLSKMCILLQPYLSTKNSNEVLQRIPPELKHIFAARFLVT